MASGTFYPAASGDDGYREGATTFATSWDGVVIGNYDVSAYKLFVRFNGVAIPQGATITECYVRFTAFGNTSVDTVLSNIYFNDADNPVAPTTYGEFDALSLTSEVVWDGLEAWTDGVQYNTPELKTILQTVVNRSGFTSGNTVILIVTDDGSNSGAHRSPSCYNVSAGAEKAELHVTWSTLGFTFTDPTPAHLSTVYGTTEQVCLTTTISGTEPEYIYDASFYDEFAVQIGTTVSGIQSGQPAESNEYLSTPSGIDYSWYVVATSSGGEDTSSTYTFHNRFLASGTTEVNGVLASGIDVRLYLRDTGELLGSTISTVSGTFNIETQYNAEFYCVALSPYTDTNSLIYDFLEPD